MQQPPEASPRKRLVAGGNGPPTSSTPTQQLSSSSFLVDLPITPVAAVHADEVVILSPSDKHTPPLALTHPSSHGRGGGGERGGGGGGRKHSLAPFNIHQPVGHKKRNAKDLVRAKKLVRALGFFYHLSLGVLFTGRVGWVGGWVGLVVYRHT